MKVIIQHNFTSGLGDFFSDMSQYMSICEELKKIGYEVHLKIVLRGNKYIDKPFIRDLLDEETINFFNSIEEIIWSIGMSHDGCTYFCSSHLPKEPGWHHIDFYFDIIPDNFNIAIYTANNIHISNILPSKIPKFNKTILDLSDKFNQKIPDDYYFFHVRTSDIHDENNSRYDSIIDRIIKYIENNNINIHLGTNNKYIYNNLKNHKNVFTYDFENYDKINNDMNAYTFFNHDFNNEPNPILFNRLQNIIAEMISIKNAKKIIFFYDIHWISNFVFYAMAVTNNKIEIKNFTLCEQQ
jgi:hypothetical protein